MKIDTPEALRVFREGFAPSISTKGLESLRDAIANDDVRLIQGTTTIPPPLMVVADWPVEAACAIGFCGWQSDDLETVGEVEEFFAKASYEADQRLGEPGRCSVFLNYFDETPRPVLFKELGVEVSAIIAKRLEES